MPASHWGSRGAAVDPRGGGGGGALEEGEGCRAHPADRFPPRFSLLAEPVIAYRLFAQDGGATVVLFLPLPFAALPLRLFSPRTEPSLRSLSPLPRVFSVSSLRLRSLLTALPLQPHLLSWLTGWTAARSEPQQGAAAQKACAPLGAKVVLGGHIVPGEREVCA